MNNQRFSLGKSTRARNGLGRPLHGFRMRPGWRVVDRGESPGPVDPQWQAPMGVPASY